MKIQFESDLMYPLAVYSSILLLKMLIMAFLTAYYRITKKVFSNPEDAANMGEKAKVKYDDSDVERVRRCHLNDMENIYVFVLVSIMYCLTNPSPYWAVWHFRIFTASRIIHMIAYLGQVPQPARGLAFGIGTVVNVSMIVQTLMKFAPRYL